MGYEAEDDGLRRAVSSQQGKTTWTARKGSRTVGKACTYRPWLEATGEYALGAIRCRGGWWLLDRVSGVWSVKTSDGRARADEPYGRAKIKPPKNSLARD